MKLYLMESYCYPVLSYALECFNLSNGCRLQTAAAEAAGYAIGPTLGACVDEPAQSKVFRNGGLMLPTVRAYTARSARQ